VAVNPKRDPYQQRVKAARAFEPREERLQRYRGSVFINLVGEITAISGNRVLRKLIAADGVRSVNLYIDSPGGDLNVASQIIKQIERLASNPCTTVWAHAADFCMSAALAIFVAAGERTAERRTVFLAHRSAIPGSDALNMNAEQLRELAAGLDTVDEKLIADLKKRLDYLPHAMRGKVLNGEDVIISPDTALRCGLVHALSKE
jgi:ATP-dependent protease ClpP protease subunit